MNIVSLNRSNDCVDKSIQSFSKLGPSCIDVN